MHTPEPGQGDDPGASGQAETLPSDASGESGAADASAGEPADADGTAPRRRRRLRDRWVLLSVLVALGVVVFGGAAGVAVLGARLNSNVERIADPFADLTDRPPVVTPTQQPGGDTPVTQLPMNVLVLGSDSRISAGDPSSWQAGSQRTDAIMLVHLRAGGDGVDVMSIPRDSWVEIPGRGMAKINAAYSYGGPTLLIQTVEQLTGVRIDHFAVADFASFTSVTDALGGVPITLTEDLYSRDGDLMLTAGERVLNGEQALTWVRERYTLARGDFDRVQRQQAWMRAILTKVSSQGLLDNPVRTVQLLDTVSRSVAVDDGVTIGVMQDVVGRLRGLKARDVEFFTVPVAGTGRSPDGRQSIVNLDRPAFDALMVAVANDQVAAYLEANGGEVDRLGETTR